MKRKILITSIIILSISIVFNLYVYYTNEENAKILEDIQISDNLKDNKQIAIKVQQDDFSWDDKGINYEEWPSTDTHEYYGSECTDVDGSLINPSTDIIKFDVTQNKATITTDRTVYCTLSFARKSTVASLLKQTTTSDYLKTVADNDELLRYVGTNDDVTKENIKNFICFGTDNIDTCLSNKETYMYRIIGITTENVNKNLGLQKDQIKIIKAAPPSDGISISWASANSNYDWDNDNATARIYLNDTSSGFLKTITGTVGTHQWSNLITSPKWYNGDDKSATSATGITNEKTSITTGYYKVGLIYASDYYNSWTYASNKNSWLHITNGITGSSSTYSRATEWTITRKGLDNGSYYRTWYVGTGGKMDWYVVNYTSAVRPVFYLTSEISISGKGTEAEPFMISDRIQ